MEKDKWKTIRINKSIYDKLDKCRNTDRGKVSFSRIIEWLLNKK